MYKIITTDFLKDVISDFFSSFISGEETDTDIRAYYDPSSFVTDSSDDSTDTEDVVEDDTKTEA